jgi:hypothetical protein
MPDGVLNYFTHERLSVGFRLESDGPATRLYRAAPPQWPRIVCAVSCFIAVSLNTGLVLRVATRVPHVLWRLPTFTGFIAEIAVENTFFLIAGVWQVLWHYRWRRTMRILEATPDGVSDTRPGLLRARTSFFPKDQIRQVELKRNESVIRGLPDRLTLIVHLKNAWVPRRCELATRNVELAEHVRHALAASLGLP